MCDSKEKPAADRDVAVTLRVNHLKSCVCLIVFIVFIFVVSKRLECLIHKSLVFVPTRLEKDRGSD